MLSRELISMAVDTWEFVCAMQQLGVCILKNR